MEEVEVEIPQYFICPISLQIMRDPVTAMTGITYDRASIEQWLTTAEDSSCPVTKQPLPRDSDLTPNHTLRRLIQAWCIANAKNGVDRIPTPKSPLNKWHVYRLIRDLKSPLLRAAALKKMEELAIENDKNRKCMAEVGAGKAMMTVILRCFRDGETSGLEQALKILHIVWSSTPENTHLVKENFDFIDALVWILTGKMDNHVVVKTHATLVLKIILKVCSSSLVERLKPDFFKQIVNIVRERLSHQATKAGLQLLIDTCPWGRNRIRIVDAGAVSDLIELELTSPEKSMTELIFCLLAQLCTCADGRAELLKHAAGIAVVSKRILRISPGTDDNGIQILSSISKFSATNEVLHEMLRVGAVSKLCMLLQADCAGHLKKKAVEILRLHSNVWNNSPCIEVYLTLYPR